MQTHTVQLPRTWLIQPLVAALVAAFSSAAWADEPSPYYIGLSETVAHNNNVYFTAGGPGDYYSTTTLLGGFDQMISRQRVYATANISYNKYQDLTELDNTSYNVTAGWDWATLEKLSGNLYANANQGLAALSGNSSTVGTRNILNTEQAGAIVNWGGDGLLSLQGTYVYSNVHYSEEQYLPSNSSSNSGSLGVWYRPAGPDLKLGTAYRVARTYSPHYVPSTTNPTDPNTYFPNTADYRFIDLLTDWKLTAQTGVNARLSWTKLSNSAPEVADFSGWSGAISATYAPTSKLTFDLGYSNAPGSNAPYFVNPTAAPGAPVIGLVQYSQSTSVFTLGAKYTITPKISTNASLQYVRAKYLNSTVTPSSGGDYYNNQPGATLGLTYDLARSWQFACNYTYLAQSYSGRAFDAFSANTFGCLAKFTLR